MNKQSAYNMMIHAREKMIEKYTKEIHDMIISAVNLGNGGVVYYIDEKLVADENPIPNCVRKWVVDYFKKNGFVAEYIKPRKYIGIRWDV
jgi:hypothetical protein